MKKYNLYNKTRPLPIANPVTQISLVHNWKNCQVEQESYLQWPSGLICYLPVPQATDTQKAQQRPVLKKPHNDFTFNNNNNNNFISIAQQITCKKQVSWRLTFAYKN